jgi:TolB-like protein/Tfp pilus assembly protein PilF
MSEGGPPPREGGSALVSQPSKGVFLSYASEDSEAAARIAAALTTAGIDVWFDRSELRGGEAWDQTIRQRIRDCRLFLPIISSTTDSRSEGYFRREWKLAIDRTQDMSERVAFIVPIVIDGTSESTADVPEVFRAVHWTRLIGGEATSDFVARIARLLSPMAVADTVPTAPLIPLLSPTAHPTVSNVLWRRTWPWVVALVLAGIAYLAFKSSVSNVDLPPTTQAVTVTTGIGPATAPTTEKSVAVLPFVDMSENKDQEYFADGLSEELIDKLAHAADLKVCARTSSFQFKGKNEDMRTIGRKLGVANLLEGSVRTSGNDIRVTAQLINVFDGAHRWSETYDRKRGDIFRIQDEIAGAVVAALKASLEQSTSSASVHSGNVDSYNEVLRGNYFWKRSTQGDSTRALLAYRQALKLDPMNAEAWLGIAATYNVRGSQGWVSPTEAYTGARQALDRALAIDPNLARAHLVRAYVEKDYNHDDGAYQREFQRALQLDPSLEARVLDAGMNAYEAGQPGKAVQLLRRNVARDPLNPLALSWLASSLYAEGNFEEAGSVWRQVLEINPDYSGAHCALGEVLLAQHQPNAALAVMSKEPEERQRMACKTDALWALGRHTEADTLLAQVQDRFPDTMAYSIAQTYALRNDKDAAFKWLNQAYSNREPAISGVNGDPEFRNLRGDPRFEALMRKVNRAD